MSKFNIEDENTRLPLPAPRPDTALDDKILDYARANTPPRALLGRGRWVAGLATAGIVAVAVMVTLPQNSPPPVPMESGPRADRGPTASSPALMKSSRMAAREELPERQALATERAAAPSADDAFAEGGTAEPAMLAGAGATAPAQAPSPENLARELDRLGETLASGDETAARAAYRQLRDNCANCQLPATLEQALLEHNLEKKR